MRDCVAVEIAGNCCDCAPHRPLKLCAGARTGHHVPEMAEERPPLGTSFLVNFIPLSGSFFVLFVYLAT
jgi:hypothetical protein